MPRPKKKKVAVVEPTEVELAMLELKQAQQELELAAANERVAQIEHRAAELEREAVRAEQEAEDVLRRAHTSALDRAADAAKQWALAERKLGVAKRRQTSKRPTPAREWPAKEASKTVVKSAANGDGTARCFATHPRRRNLSTSDWCCAGTILAWPYA